MQNTQNAWAVKHMLLLRIESKVTDVHSILDQKYLRATYIHLLGVYT